MNRGIPETGFIWVFLGILFGVLGFLVAYLSDAFIHCVTTHEQLNYVYWVETRSLSNWPVYLFVSVFFASLGLLYVYVTKET